jgi:Zn-dependent M28 family amino/carboxypeptidase
VKTLLFWLFIVGLFGAASTAYMTQMPGASFRGKLPALTDDEQDVSESLARHVEAIAGSGSRGTHAPAVLNDAGDYINSQLRHFGYDVSNVVFDDHGLSYSNYEVTLPGARSINDLIVVGAHYDSVVGSPGADADASGCAVLLEIARAMNGHNSERTVKLVFFALGAGPLAGDEKSAAARYARDQRKNGNHVMAMLALDSIGTYRDTSGSQTMPFPLGIVFPSQGNFLLFAGDIGSRDVVRATITEFRKFGHFPSEGLVQPQFMSPLAMSDDEGFRMQGFPAIVITDTGKLRNTSIGTAPDTADKLDFGRMARVSTALVHVVQSLALHATTL